MNPLAVQQLLGSIPGSDAREDRTISIAVTTDLASVHALRRQVLRLGYLHRFGVASPDDAAPGTFHLLAFLGQTAIGACSFVPSRCPPRPGPATEIIGMAVVTRRQKTGIGSALLQHGLTLMPADSSWIWAKARCTALGFYVRQGFRPVSNVYDILPGVPHRTVIRHLLPTPPKLERQGD